MSDTATALSRSEPLTMKVRTSATYRPRYWTPDEEVRLVQMRGTEGLFVTEIAPLLKRSEYSVRTKIAAMGLRMPDNWQELRGRKLPEAKVTALRRHWLRGEQIEAAASAAGTSIGTAERLFVEFSEQERAAAVSPIIGTYIGHKEMMAIVAPICGVPASAITGPTRLKPNVCARMAIAKALRERGVSLPQIAKKLGRTDHSTVINYLRKFDSYAVVYPETRRAYEAIKRAEALAAERLAA